MRLVLVSDWRVLSMWNIATKSRRKGERIPKEHVLTLKSSNALVVAPGAKERDFDIEHGKRGSVHWECTGAFTSMDSSTRLVCEQKQYLISGKRYPRICRGAAPESYRAALHIWTSSYMCFKRRAKSPGTPGLPGSCRQAR